MVWATRQITTERGMARRRARRRGRAVRTIAGLGALVSVVAWLGGCNTFKGVGRDVEAIAQGGQDIIDGK